MTTLRDDLRIAGLAALPLDHDWSLPLGNGFLAAHAETRPRLATALDALSEPARFGLSVAAAEWVAARVTGHADVGDAHLRLDAAWAATVDPALARLPKPAKTPDDADLRAARPLRLAMLLLGIVHDAVAADDPVVLFGGTLRLVMVAEHVAGRVPLFQPWLKGVLQGGAAQHGVRPGVPYGQQPSVTPSFYRLPGGVVPSDVPGEQAALRAALQPAQNPYLK